MDKQGGQLPAIYPGPGESDPGCPPGCGASREKERHGRDPDVPAGRGKALVYGEHGWDMLDPAGTSKKRRQEQKALSLLDTFSRICNALFLVSRRSAAIGVPVRCRPTGRRKGSAWRHACCA
jgi:hypothetical protein